jgi:hypothetical protein
MLADQLDYVIGVDPHRDTHALAIVDVRTGGIVLETSVPANSSGYARALELAELHAHPVDDPSCVLLEVDAIDERAWRESGPVEDDELELLGQWPLLSRRGVTVPDAAMDEDNTLHSRGLAPRIKLLRALDILAANIHSA